MKLNKGNVQLILFACHVCRQFLHLFFVIYVFFYLFKNKQAAKLRSFENERIYHCKFRGRIKKMSIFFVILVITLLSLAVHHTELSQNISIDTDMNR